MSAKAGWLIASAAIALVGRMPPAAALTPPERSLTEQLPADTVLAVMIDNQAETWAELTQFELFRLMAAQSGQSIHPGLPYLPGGGAMLTPWAGTTAVVALPSPSAPTTPLVNAMVMLVPVTDATARDAYLMELSERRGAPERHTYQETPLLYWPPKPELEPQPEPEPDSGTIQIRPLAAKAGLVGLPAISLPASADASGVAIALLSDVLVAADNLPALQQFLDQRPGEAADLGDQPDFQRSLNHPQLGRATVAFYGDLGAMLRYGSDDLGRLSEVLPVPSVPAIEREMARAAEIEGSFEGLVYRQSEGLRLQGRLYLDNLSANLFAAYRLPERSRNSLFDQLPAATYALASSYNLAGSWQMLASFLENFSGRTREGLNAVRSFVQLTTGLDLDEELLGWMDGEFALFAFPSETSPLMRAFPPAQVALGGMIQTRDRSAADRAIAGFGALFELFELPLTARTVNGKPIVDLELDRFGAEPLSVLSYGWGQDDTLILATGRGPMARLMNPTPFDPLRQHSTFRSATADFPQPNNGYFYVNAGASLLLAYGLLDIRDDPDRPYEITDYLAGLRSLSLTTAATDDYLQIDGLLGLAPRQAMP